MTQNSSDDAQKDSLDESVITDSFQSGSESNEDVVQEKNDYEIPDCLLYTSPSPRDRG